MPSLSVNASHNDLSIYILVAEIIPYLSSDLLPRKINGGAHDGWRFLLQSHAK
jgi:hypothetical protein